MPAAARRRPARGAGDVRGELSRLLADLAAVAVWLPGQYAWEKEPALQALTVLVGDLARAAVAVRAFPACPPDWPGYSCAAAVALAAASEHEPDLEAWLVTMLETLPSARGGQE